MIFENVSNQYIEEAVQIAVWEYEREYSKCPQLINENFKAHLTGLLSALFQEGTGKVAIEGGKVVGYLVFWGPWEGFHGLVKGVFSPLGGSGMMGTQRDKIASMLFEKVGEELISKGICAYAISRYAHDDEVGRSFILNGFGIRCSDAIMRLSERNIPYYNEKIIYTELIGKEKTQIEPLTRKICKHLSQGPTFFPCDLQGYDWVIKDDGVRVFVAKDKATNEVIGYISVKEEDAETFITKDERIANICGTYVEEKYRKSEAAQGLLEYVCQVMEGEGKTYLGVDCETLNPTALRFWGKYFSSYTYSYFRRLDERIVGYDTYFKQTFLNMEKGQIL